MSDAREDERLHDVRLLGVPVRVLVASRQHHDELMHEFALLAVAEPQEDVPQRMITLIDTLGRQYASATERPDSEVDAGLARGDDTVDLTYHVSAHVVEAADRLAELMREADEFCAREEMLTMQRSETMREFAQWYLDEFRRQVGGEPPRPWDGPLDA